MLKVKTVPVPSSTTNLTVFQKYLTKSLEPGFQFDVLYSAYNSTVSLLEKLLTIEIKKYL